MTYYTRLKQLSLTCEFANVDREITSQIVQHGRSQRLRRKALADPTITLAKLLDMGKAMELADTQAASLEKRQQRPESANCLTVGSRRSNPNNNSRRDLRDKTKDKPPPRTTPSVKCRNREGNYPQAGGKTACPAHGKQSRSFGKLNHYQSVCLQGTRCPQKPPATRQTKRTPLPHKPPRQEVRILSEDEGTEDSGEYGLFSINVNNVNSD